MTVKVREVANILHAKGVERGVIYLITDVMERQAKLEKDMVDNAQIILHMSQMLSQVVDGAGAMRGQIEGMLGQDEDDDLPPAQEH